MRDECAAAAWKRGLLRENGVLWSVGVPLLSYFASNRVMLILWLSVLPGIVELRGNYYPKDVGKEVLTYATEPNSAAPLPATRQSF